MLIYSFFYKIITLLTLILTVESSHNIFVYDDGNGDNEHCCLARVNEKFCLTTPLTRSLIQINKQCHRLYQPKKHRSGQKYKKFDYLGKISRRLNIETIHHVDDKILIELRKPLEEYLLENDVVCLTSTNNHINLNKCYVEFLDDINNDVNQTKNNCEKNENCKNKNVELQDDLHRIDLNQSIKIRENLGLSIENTFKLNVKNFQPKNHQQRQCLTWYRKQTDKLRQKSSKTNKTCIRLNDNREKCLHQLVFNKFNKTNSNDKKIFLSLGTNLYCQNPAGFNKLIGHYHYGEICFYSNNQISIEHIFTDIADLHQIHKNENIVQFIMKNKKFQMEYENDCKGKVVIPELVNVEIERQMKVNHNKKNKKPKK